MRMGRIATRAQARGKRAADASYPPWLLDPKLLLSAVGGRKSARASVKHNVIETQAVQELHYPRLGP
eukprot:15458953-Alexandrium_andersonii.AAC.1